MVTAIILINAEQGRVPDVAEELLRVPGIAEVYSVAGQYDLVAIARVRQHEELADLVARHLHRLPGIVTTNTLTAFRAYAQRDLAAMWELGLEDSAS